MLLGVVDMRCRSIMAKVISISLAAAPFSLGAREDGNYVDGEPKDFVEVNYPDGLNDEALTVSMFGWGLLLAIGISVISIAVGSNDNSQAP